MNRTAQTLKQLWPVAQTQQVVGELPHRARSLLQKGANSGVVVVANGGTRDVSHASLAEMLTRWAG